MCSWIPSESDPRSVRESFECGKRHEDDRVFCTHELLVSLGQGGKIMRRGFGFGVMSPSSSGCQHQSLGIPRNTNSQSRAEEAVAVRTGEKNNDRSNHQTFSLGVSYYL